MKKHLFEASLLIGLCFALLISAHAAEEQRDISAKLIRLHIVANSNSDSDQRLKLEVRDRILEYMHTSCKNLKNKKETEDFVKKNIDTFVSIANSVCKENKVSYRACATLSNSRFPTKNYGNFSLPAGKYEALRIKLGNAGGENWWCVLFPPLCISAAEEYINLEKSGLSEDEMLFITSEKPEYRIKFKLLELIEKLV